MEVPNAGPLRCIPRVRAFVVRGAREQPRSYSTASGIRRWAVLPLRAGHSRAPISRPRSVFCAAGPGESSDEPSAADDLAAMLRGVEADLAALAKAEADGEIALRKLEEQRRAAFEATVKAGERALETGLPMALPDDVPDELAGKISVSSSEEVDTKPGVGTGPAVDGSSTTTTTRRINIKMDAAGEQAKLAELETSLEAIEEELQKKAGAFGFIHSKCICAPTHSEPIIT